MNQVSIPPLITLTRPSEWDECGSCNLNFYIKIKQFANDCIFKESYEVFRLHNENKIDYSVFLQNLDFKEGIKVLNSYLRERGEFIPPLINIYMGLSPSMKTFGTAINSDFGNVEETGIMVTISDIYPEKKERHMDF